MARSEYLAFRCFEYPLFCQTIPVNRTNYQFLHSIHFSDIRRDRPSGLLEAIDKVKLARASLR